MRLVALLILAAAVLTGSYHLAKSAPCGDFHTLPTLHRYDDPDAWYLNTGIHLRSKFPYHYVGHPGIPLKLMINKIVYAMRLVMPEEKSLAKFAKVNIVAIAIAVRIALAILQILAFASLYLLFKELSSSKYVALIGAAGYTTSYTVMTMFLKISTESQIVIFVSLALWSALKCLSKTRIDKRLIFYAALTGTMCSLMVFTKAHIATPIPLVILVMLLGIGSLVRREAIGKTLVQLVIFLSSLGLTAYFLQSFMSWTNFFAYWKRYSPGNPIYKPWNEGFTDNLILLFDTMAGMVTSVSRYTQVFYSTGSNYRFIFANEIIFIFAGGIGIILMALCKRELFFKSWPLFLAALVTLPLAVYRGDHHYFIVIFMALAFYVAYLTEFIWNHTSRYLDFIISKMYAASAKFIFGSFIIAMLHFNNFKTFVDYHEGLANSYQLATEKNPDYACPVIFYYKKDIKNYNSWFLDELPR